MKVISSCLVKIESNAAAPMSRMELTPWDLQLLLLDPIQKGILFHKPAQESLILHLKNSLSRTLHFFPPLSGRIGTIHNNDDNTTSFFIDCNNAGVEFVHAVAANVSVSDILEPTYIPEIVSQFFPLNGLPNCEGVSKPVLGVQVTELVDGLFIACTANHCIVDGTSFWHFFNSWSEISRGGFDSTISKPPVFERWFPSNVSRVVRLPPLEPMQDSVSSPLLERVFHFSRETLTKLKSEANFEGVSSLQALSAHLWQSITRCSHSLQSSKETRLIMVVGARARIPLPEGYFGNAFRLAATAIPEAEVVNKGLGFVAMKINELVAEQTREALIKGVEDWAKSPVVYRKGSISINIFITSSPRHNVYGNDFGWGKPIAVRSGKGQKCDGKMTLFPAAVAGGIDVEVCLAPEILQALGDDAQFMGV